jgi:hypothetical protein
VVVFWYPSSSRHQLDLESLRITLKMMLMWPGPFLRHEGEVFSLNCFCDELVYEQWPALSAFRASQEAGTELLSWKLFSRKAVSFSSLHISPTRFNVLLFSPDYSSATLPPHRLNHISPLPHTYQSEIKFFLHLSGDQLCPRGVQSARKLYWTMRFPPEQMMGHTIWNDCTFGGVKSQPSWSQAGI